MCRYLQHIAIIFFIQYITEDDVLVYFLNQTRLCQVAFVIWPSALLHYIVGDIHLVRSHRRGYVGGESSAMHILMYCHSTWHHNFCIQGKWIGLKSENVCVRTKCITPTGAAITCYPGRLSRRPVWRQYGTSQRLIPVFVAILLRQSLATHKSVLTCCLLVSEKRSMVHKRWIITVVRLTSIRDVISQNTAYLNIASVLSL